MEAAQGVKAVCVTPHLRQGMFETPDAALRRQYERLCGIADSVGIRLYLSREYHYDSLFREKLREGSLLPIGEKTILTEFSAAHSAEQLLSAVKEIRSYGYVPLIAHVERYPAADIETAEALRGEGALIQLNADAVLGHEGRYLKKRAWALLKAGLADVIATDAHDTEQRPPRLRECYTKLAKKTGIETADRLLKLTPKKILEGQPED